MVFLVITSTVIWYSVSPMDTMTLFFLYYYGHLSAPIPQQIGLLLQPGHGRSICHLAQVETGVKLANQGGCPEA